MTKNFVLLTIDSLRADHATPDAGLMPVLNEYAESGVRFPRAYANGYSTPISFPTLLTGTYANHYGGHGYMSDERPFLAPLFQEHGFETAAFHSNPHLRKEKNYHTGFDVYNDFQTDADPVSRLRYRVTQTLDSDSLAYKLLKRAYHFFRTTSGSTDYVDAPSLNQRALSWLDQREGDRPFFLWIHYMDVHYPFYPPDRFLREATGETIATSRALEVNGKMHEDGSEISEDDAAALNSLYKGDVQYMDHHLKELFTELKSRDVFDDTVFAITSDHGELFGENGLYGHPPSGFEESFHVPLVLFGPDIPEHTTVDSTVSLIDIPPTVAKIFDLDANPKWEGVSLFPVESDTGRESPGAILGDESVLAYQNGEWRLVWWREQQHPTEPGREWQLWNIHEQEWVPLEEKKEVVTSLREELEAFISRAEQTQAVEEPAVDSETADRLEALGYR